MGREDESSDRVLLKTFDPLHAVSGAMSSYRLSQAIAVCASTGVAAVHVNGCTLHSFLGCGLGREADWERAVKNKQAEMSTS